MEVNGIDNKENKVDEDLEQEEITIGKKRTLRRKKDVKMRELEKKKAEKKIGKYYGQSYVGDSIAGIMYNLSLQLNKENNKVNYL